MLVLSANAAAQVAAQKPSVAVLDFGDTSTGRAVADKVSEALSSVAAVSVVDRGQARAAARGAGYTGSLNMTLEEARDLGAAIDCDFFITGDAQTLRRSPSAGPTYYEAYAAVFVVGGVFDDGRAMRLR
ncbi:MAG TPA: hypothetical protein VF507_10815 [Pyrinomonadaceae bacterium]